MEMPALPPRSTGQAIRMEAGDRSNDCLKRQSTDTAFRCTLHARTQSLPGADSSPDRQLGHSLLAEQTRQQQLAERETFRAMNTSRKSAP